MRQESIQPEPVTWPIIACPLAMVKERFPSVMMSFFPVTTTTAPLWRARSMAKFLVSMGLCAVMAASTPAHSVFVPAIAAISETLPRIAVTRMLLRSRPIPSCRNAEAPAPTGSKTTGSPNSLARFPANSMAENLSGLGVPKLSTRLSLLPVISAASSGASAMIGDAPMASSTLAQSVAVT